MNYALRRNHDLLPFDARGAARDAARREGKTLGEWLRDVIADHAADLGQAEEFLSDQQRAEAVARRLHPADASMYAPARPRAVQGYPASGDRAWGPSSRQRESDSAFRRSPAPEIAAQDRILERAVDILGCEPRDAPRQADAWGTRAPSPQRLRPVPPSDPFLEGPEPARASRPAPSAEGIEHLEHKLDSILKAVQTRPASPAPAQDDDRARAAAQRPDRRLGQAIADVVRRQRTLNLAEIQPVAPRVPLRRRNARPADAAAPATAPALTPAACGAPPAARSRQEVQADIAALCTEIAHTLRHRQDRVGAPQPAPPVASVAPPAGPQGPQLCRDPYDGFGLLAEAAPVTSAPVMPTPVPPAPVAAEAPCPASLQAVPCVSAPPPAPARTVPSVVESVALSAIGTLQQQLADLSHRFERTETYGPRLDSVDQRLLQLAADQTLASGRFEAALAQAPRRAMEALLSDGRFANLEAAARGVADLRHSQEIAESRTMSALDSVRESLEKVADKLVSVEHRIVTAPLAGPTPIPTTMPTQAATAAKLEADAVPASEPAAPNATAAVSPIESFARTPRADAPIERRAHAVERDFIAQARHAAMAARKPAVDPRRPLLMPAAASPPVGMAQKAQALLTRHRRVIGVGLAAGCVVAGLVEVANLSLLDGVLASAETVHLARSPSPKAPNALGSGPAANQLVRGETAPAEAPASRAPDGRTIFGTDPIQTASFTRMPTHPAAPFAPAQVAISDDAPTAFAQGEAFAQAHDFTRAAQAFTRAAERGIVPAQARLASFYEKGLGLDRNREKARALYLQAAEAGNPRAMHNLAVLLTDGAGHPDYEAAATWFRRAAQFGLRDSQFNLGVLYAEGIGLPQSYSESFQWFAIAAAQGDDGAAKKRDLVAAKLSTDELLVAKAVAGSFRPRQVDPAAVDVTRKQDGAPAVSANRV